MASSGFDSGMRSEAAVVLQSRYRGYRARKEYKRIREERKTSEGGKDGREEENLDLEFVEKGRDLDGVETTGRNEFDASVDGMWNNDNERKEDTRVEVGRETNTEPESSVQGEESEEKEKKDDEIRNDSHALQNERLLQDNIVDTQQKEVNTRETEKSNDERQRKSTKKVIETSSAEKQKDEQLTTEKQTTEKLDAKRLEADKHNTEKRETERIKSERVKAKKLEAQKPMIERHKAERLKSERQRQGAEKREDKKEVNRDEVEKVEEVREEVKLQTEQTENERHTVGDKEETQEVQDSMKNETAEAAATIIQKNYRGYLVRREYPKLESKNQEITIRPSLHPPMLSQQIVDEVTRAMAIIMNHSKGTLTQQQVERTNALQDKPVEQLQRWMRPKQQKEELQQVKRKEDHVELKHVKGYARTNLKMPTRPDGIRSLKAPTLQPHPLKKTTNYLRTYLRTVGRPEKASADIRLRFKCNPRQQPPELTNIWDIKRQHENGKLSKVGKGVYGYDTSLAANADSLWDSHVTKYRHSMPPEPWQVLHQSGSYEDRLSSGLYSNAVMSDWTAASSLHSLQHTYSQSADSDFSGATVSSGLNDSPMFKRNFSFNEMYSAVRESTDNKWVTGRAPHNVAGRRLEPLQRRTDRWAARPMQSKQTSSMGYAARHKSLAEINPQF
ncbi:uncharacterized protein LOC134187071 isoform X2 [Corticium candelabrum]|uniref:uncharacterized protein LOC134187071 isoform X2 n=1 Tax=Corticium candelabrum TaxID=121492 RepID=UPI002E25637C|nr:uncharacterized protein LOC134187071 isoform X2 [Corticium candelabrum]